MINNCAKVDGWKLNAPILIQDLAPLIDGINKGTNSRNAITRYPFIKKLLFLKTSKGIATENTKNAI